MCPCLSITRLLFSFYYQLFMRSHGVWAVRLRGDFNRLFLRPKEQVKCQKFPSKMSTVCSLTCRKGLEALIIKPDFQARDLEWKMTAIGLYSGSCLLADFTRIIFSIIFNWYEKLTFGSWGRSPTWSGSWCSFHGENPFASTSCCHSHTRTFEWNHCTGWWGDTAMVIKQPRKD